MSLISVNLFDGLLSAEGFPNGLFFVQYDMGFVSQGYVSVQTRFFETDIVGQIFDEVQQTAVYGYLNLSDVGPAYPHESAFYGSYDASPWGQIGKIGPQFSGASHELKVVFQPSRLVRISPVVNYLASGPVPIKVSIHYFKDTGLLSSN